MEKHLYILIEHKTINAKFILLLLTTKTTILAYPLYYKKSFKLRAFKIFNETQMELCIRVGRVKFKECHLYHL